MAQRLSEFTANIKLISRRGPAQALIQGLAYDSRQVEPGFLFFALPGIHENGEVYIDKAIAAGALAIVHQSPLREYKEGISYIQVEDSRFSMSAIAAAFYDSPSASLGVIGVTGTEGKSSTVYLIYQLLWLCGRKAGFISTVQYRSGAQELWNPEHQTTPEATTIHRALAQMVDYGMEFAVIEASSHGLSARTNRLGDVLFDAAVILNVRHEHLEFHGSLEQYRQDKANLFRALDGHEHKKTILGAQTAIPAFAVVNADDPYAGIYTGATDKPAFSFGGAGSRADIRALRVHSDEGGNDIDLDIGGRAFSARINLPGAFNVDNCLAALLCVSHILERDAAELLPFLPLLKPVRGRMTRIDCGQAFELIVDYAHTPSSFQAILPSLRERVSGKIICLFGSGGERDLQKRPQQGRIAADYCDTIILADEDPRGEDPVELLEMIAAGCPEKQRDKELFIIPDRPTALLKALSSAKAGDLVLLLGKGHENSIIGKGGSRPYDEISEAQAALAEIGFCKNEG